MDGEEPERNGLTADVAEMLHEWFWTKFQEQGIYHLFP